MACPYGDVENAREAAAIDEMHEQYRRVSIPGYAKIVIGYRETAAEYFSFLSFASEEGAATFFELYEGEAYYVKHC
jgi:homoserine kinase